jgi:hypothetical protein
LLNKCIEGGKPASYLEFFWDKWTACSVNHGKYAAKAKDLAASALEKGPLETISFFWEKSVYHSNEADIKNGLTNTQYSSHTAMAQELLELAAQKGSLETIRFFWNKWTDYSKQDNNGQETHNGYAAEAQMLIELAVKKRASLEAVVFFWDKWTDHSKQDNNGQETHSGYAAEANNFLAQCNNQTPWDVVQFFLTKAAEHRLALNTMKWEQDSDPVVVSLQNISEMLDFASRADNGFAAVANSALRIAEAIHRPLCPEEI